MSAADEIRLAIDARVDELREEISCLEAARAALCEGDGGSVASPGAPRPRSRATRRRAMTAAAASVVRAATQAANGSAAQDAVAERPIVAELAPRRKITERASGAAPRRRRSGVAVQPGSLMDILSETPDGLSTASLAERADSGAAQVLVLVREMERSGEVRREGAGRSTRWRIVTDEERIAERVAELEKLSGSPTSKRQRVPVATGNRRQ